MLYSYLEVIPDLKIYKVMNSEKWYELIKKIDDCFLMLSENHLPCPEDVVDRYKWLDEEANYSILAHDNSVDPIFIYANKFALSCFKYTVDEMLFLPSRFSASASNRSAREQLLKTVTKNGIAYNYSGDRIDKSGNSFTIYDGIVWELKDQNGEKWGQAALFYTEKQ